MSEHTKLKKKRKKALSKVKEFAIGSEVYNEYLLIKKQTDLAWDNFKEVRDDEKVFEFNSLQLFMGEFGPMFGFFIYAIFNLFLNFYTNKKNIGVTILHGFIISVTLFYFFWMFQKFQDFSKPIYYLMTIFSATIVVLAVFLISKYNDLRINKYIEAYKSIEQKNREIALKFFLNIQEDKREEMLDFLREELKDKP